MLTSRLDKILKPLQGTFDQDDQIPKFLELMRWPEGVRCPYCPSSKVTRLQKPKRKPEGRYLYYCRACRRQFTVTTKTALDHTHVRMAKWLDAIAMIRNRSSRRLKPAELEQSLGVTRKTSVLMCRRLREGMKKGFLRVDAKFTSAVTARLVYPAILTPLSFADLSSPSGRNLRRRVRGQLSHRASAPQWSSWYPRHRFYAVGSAVVLCKKPHGTKSAPCLRAFALSRGEVVCPLAGGDRQLGVQENAVNLGSPTVAQTLVFQFDRFYMGDERSRVISEK